MIFVGDVAMPFEKGIDFINYPQSFNSKKWIINLEGALVDKQYAKGVYNNRKAFEKFHKAFPVELACLANNHIADTEPISDTIDYLDSCGIKNIGAGNSKNYNRVCLIDNFVLLNFAWEVIQAIPATNNTDGVNLLIKSHVINEFKKAKEQFPSKKIIVIFHWNFELELYPMPQQRELAKLLIDKGAELIIGHHSHLLQGIETYKNKFIVHGLGNWAFAQNAYSGGKLRFPIESLRQGAFEFKNDSAILHLFNYNIEQNEIHFDKSIELKNTSSFEAPYQNLSQKEYLTYFKKNRIKRKALPIYKWSDPIFILFLKNKYMKLRDLGIKLIRR